MTPFIRILVEDIMAFAYCSDSKVDSDYAIANLTRIAQSVAAAGEDSVSAFRQTVELMAKEARG